MTEGVGRSYPLSFDFDKTTKDNKQGYTWIKRIDSVLRDNIKSKDMASFGTHFTIEFVNWEKYNNDEIAQKLSDVLVYLSYSLLHSQIC